MKFKNPLIILLNIGTAFFLYCTLMFITCAHNLDMATIHLNSSSFYYRAGARQEAEKERDLANKYINKSNNLKKWIPSFMIRK